MDVTILDMQKLFAPPIRYEIPLFQRPYVWSHAEQWGPLWEDVQNTAERYLEELANGMTRRKSPAHFLGAVVLQQQQVPTPMLMTRIVVDGQQRLTTLQLLLDAVQEVFEQRGDDAAAKRLELLVLNNEAFLGGNPDNAFKIWPTMADQEAFRYTMHNHLHNEGYEESLIAQAHNFFKLQASQWLDGQSPESGNRAEALEQAIAHLLELVVIDLDQTDDPHVIFETLNARGTALLQSDLIKNMILHEGVQKGVASDAEAAARLWDFQATWWREDVQQGRTIRPRIDVFLNYWMVLRTRDEVTADNVFSTFRRYYDTSAKSTESIASDIARIGEHYESLEKALNTDMATFLYRREVMQAGILTPILLWLLSSPVPQGQLTKGLRAIESHQLRRMICRMSTMGNNRLFVSLIDELEKAGAEKAGDTIVEYLGNQTSNVGVWPTDQQMEQAFINLPLFRLLTRGRLRIVLEGIEEELRTDKTENKSAPRNLTIEHIMPRQWRECWADPSHMEDVAEAKRLRDELIHTIGNLTLVTQPLNSTLSNDPWNDKRATINDHSVLFLNKTLLDDAPDVWDEAAIEERARQLCQIAVKVWPHAEDMQRS